MPRPPPPRAWSREPGVAMISLLIIMGLCWPLCPPTAVAVAVEAALEAAPIMDEIEALIARRCAFVRGSGCAAFYRQKPIDPKTGRNAPENKRCPKDCRRDSRRANCPAAPHAIIPRPSGPTLPRLATPAPPRPASARPPRPAPPRHTRPACHTRPASMRTSAARTASKTCFQTCKNARAAASECATWRPACARAPRATPGRTARSPTSGRASTRRAPNDGCCAGGVAGDAVRG